MLNNCCILLVDDDRDTQDLYRTALQYDGASVIVTGSACEALQLLVLHQPDILISDVVLPKVDGFSLIRSIRGSSVRSVRQIPAIAVTGFAAPDIFFRAQRAGFDRCLLKPTDLDNLAQEILKLVSPTVTVWSWNSQAS